jgi:hypothetical protein
MKIKIINGFVFFVLVIFFSSCEYDNYDPPTSQITWMLSYQNDTIYSNNVVMECRQKGYQGTNPISLTVDNWGVFRSLFFDGTYYLTPLQTNYPFLWEDFTQQPDGSFDTLVVEVNGDHNMIFKITPYFEITNMTASYNSGEQTIDVGYDIATVVNDSAVTINTALLFYQTSILINRSTPSIERERNPDVSQRQSFSVDLADYKRKYPNNYRQYIFVRAALETNISQSFLWSKVMKLDLPDGWWDQVE